MQKKRLFAIIAILVVSMVCFIGCADNNDKDNDIDKDHKKILKLLENGEYDRAIAMIKEIRDEKYLEENQASIDKEKEEFIDSIQGTYLYNSVSFNRTNSPDFTINSDLTIIYNGQTYPYEIHDYTGSNTNSKYYINFKYTTSEGYESSRSLHPYIDENGYALCDGYIRMKDLEVDAKKQFLKYVGKYVYEYASEKKPDVTIKDDFTASIDGKSYPIEYMYDDYSKKIMFYIMGYSRYQSNASNSYESLSITTKENHQVFLWDRYYRPDQLDFVEITADNLYDYFEWTDWYVADGDISRNAFGEISGISFKRGLQLKEEYVPYFYDKASDVAIEFQYNQDLFYKDTTFQYNLDSGKSIVTLGGAQLSNYYDKPGSFTATSMNYYGSNVDGKYVIKALYLLGESQWFSVNDNSSFDGSTYTFTMNYYSKYDQKEFCVARSKTTLAFVKKEL